LSAAPIGADALSIAGPGLGADVLADPNIAIFAGDSAGASLPDTSPLATGPLDSSITGDVGAAGTDIASTATPAATTPSATPAGFAPTDTELAGGATGTAAATTAATPATAAGGGVTGALGNVMSSPWTKLGLGLAPLGLALGMREANLSTGGQAAQGNANQLAAFGQQQLAQAQAGQLNQGQLASLNQMRQDLTNQWKQVFFNMGVQDPSKDTRWTQAMADIDNKITAQTATFIQQMIQNGLQAASSASGTLTQVAQMQMQADQNFTNNLINATKALGTTVAGGQTITLKAA